MQVGVGTKIVIFDQYLASFRVYNGPATKCDYTDAPDDRSKLVTLVAAASFVVRRRRSTKCL